MADLKFQFVQHDHMAFLDNASKRRGLDAAYDALEFSYALAHEILAARTRIGSMRQAPLNPGHQTAVEHTLKAPWA